MNGTDLETMAEAYIECALFTASEDLIPPKSGEFDATPFLPRITKGMRETALRVCSEFFHANAPDLDEYPADSAGHDLWYTRNGHGVGFWENDHCTEEQGQRLTDAAHKLGENGIYKRRGGWFAFEWNK
jgi:hypothetical protein